MLGTQMSKLAKEAAEQAAASSTNPAGRGYTDSLPNVSDPRETFAAITRQSYDDYIANFRDFENRLLGQINDTSIVDAARGRAERQTQISRGIQRRNLERYGGAGLSAAQLQEQQRALQRGGQLAISNNLNRARIAQRQQNQNLMRQLVNLGQGLGAEGMAGLGNAAQSAQQRANAYRQAKANYSSQMTGLGTTLLLAAFGV